MVYEVYTADGESQGRAEIAHPEREEEFLEALKSLWLMAEEVVVEPGFDCSPVVYFGRDDDGTVEISDEPVGRPIWTLRPVSQAEISWPASS